MGMGEEFIAEGKVPLPVRATAEQNTGKSEGIPIVLT